MALSSWLIVVALLLGGMAGLARPGRASADPPGVALAWGDNFNRTLGNGDPNNTANRPVPGPVIGLGNISAVQAGFTSAAALLPDGTVRAWGDEGYGQLGNGAANFGVWHSTPVTVCATGSAATGNCVPLTNVKSLAVGYNHVLALLNDGSVRAWGRGNDGQLGHGDNNGSANPVVVCAPEATTGCPAMGNVVAVAAGNYRSLALRADGLVYEWGGGASISANRPKLVCAQGATCPGLTNVVAIAAGGEHDLALTSDGRVWSWGVNIDGQLGKGEYAAYLAPVNVCASGSGLACPQLGGVKAIAASQPGTDSSYSMALLNDGTIRTWGRNIHGQLGTGVTGANSTLPVPVTGVGGTGTLNNVAAIAAGTAFGTALLTDGTVRAWGANAQGQLGDGTTTPRPAPVVVCASGSGPACPALGGIAALEAGFAFTLALSGPLASPSPSPSPGPVPTFRDVPPGYWARDQIGLFGARGITTGCDVDLYCPDRDVNRAEMAVFVDRTLGYRTPPTPASQAFADVPPGYWAYAFIDTFRTLGITTGCGPGEFCPERGVTRAEMAAFLIRALKQGQAAPATPTFADVPATHPQFGYVEALVAAGVTRGCGDDGQGHLFYCPDRPVSRAEMAVFIIRAFP